MIGKGPHCNCNFAWQNWVNYFNTYFSEAGLTGDFNEDSIVIVETLNYFESFTFAVTE